MDEKIDDWIMAALEFLAKLSPEKRVDVLCELEQEFCRHCGSEQGCYCHCSNDE